MLGIRQVWHPAIFGKSGQIVSGQNVGRILPHLSTGALSLHVNYLQFTEVIKRTGSILWHVDFMPHHGICRLPQNLMLSAEKRGIARFCYIISDSRFFGLLFNFTIYETIKSSCCKLTFVIIMSIMT